MPNELNRIARVVAVVALSLLASACEQDNPVESPVGPQPIQVSAPQLDGGITPMCQLGCIPGDDPDPEADGIFVGEELSDVFCGDAEASNDLDQDGMSDYCEKVLAEGFAPVIRYADTDDVSRESYWAARRLPDGKVRIFYAIGYYFDLGVISSVKDECKIVELLVDCEGHNGDSESIVLDVYFNPSTSHWLLNQAWYSHHKTPYLFMRTPKGKTYPTVITYMGNKGGVPLAWVARKKHANYTSQSTCNDGGGAPGVIADVFSWDDCTGNNTTVPLDALGSRNLGSNSHRFIDCVSSLNPFYQDPPRPQECMWSASQFYGWQLDHTEGEVEGYGPKLRSFGF